MRNSGNPASPSERFGPDHRARLKALIEKTLMADDVNKFEQMRDVYEREEMAAIAAAAPDGGWPPAGGDAPSDADRKCRRL
jgi:hypothetical protein